MNCLCETIQGAAVVAAPLVLSNSACLILGLPPQTHKWEKITQAGNCLFPVIYVADQKNE
jgi:hypothetical protein